uniref:CSON002149 protein n=1 Tax=Culicoides sonorensis TaxID=179676 RepID=A0A336MMW9_CULSO
MDLKIATILILKFSFSFLVQATFDIYFKSLKCGKPDPTYAKVERCQIKAERGKKGVFYINITHPQPVTKDRNIWIHGRIFYKTSTGALYPYMVDAKAEVCEIYKFFDSTNPLMKMIVKVGMKAGTREFVNQVRKGCPIKGPIVADGFDPNAVKDYLPPIVPEGIFKIVLRAYEPRTNHTMMDGHMYVELKSHGISDRIKIG